MIYRICKLKYNRVKRKGNIKDLYILIENFEEKTLKKCHVWHYNQTRFVYKYAVITEHMRKRTQTPFVIKYKSYNIRVITRQLSFIMYVKQIIPSTNRSAFPDEINTFQLKTHHKTVYNMHHQLVLIR